MDHKRYIKARDIIVPKLNTNTSAGSQGGTNRLKSNRMSENDDLNSHWEESVDKDSLQLDG